MKLVLIVVFLVGFIYGSSAADFPKSLAKWRPNILKLIQKVLMCLLMQMAIRVILYI